MPLRKRAATKQQSSTTRKVKRSATRKVKREKVSKLSRDNVIATADLTAQNAIQSPLLRLPAELRNGIWELTYGNMMIGIRFGYSHHIDYYPVHKSKDEYTPRRDKHVRLPGFVCKQFWTEASGVFLSSFTLRPDGPDIFRALVESRSPLVLQVRNMFLISRASCPASWAVAWAYVLTPSIVSQLENLQGLHLKLQTEHDFYDMWHTTDIMNDRTWEYFGFAAIIRTFQRHKLHDALTSVHIDHWVETDHQCRCPSTICEVIRKNLLQHKPRRQSIRRVQAGKQDA